MKPGRIAFGLALFTAVALAVSPASAGAGSKYRAVRSAKGTALRFVGTAAASKAAQANWLSAGTMNQQVVETGGGAFVGGRLYVPGGYINNSFTALFDKMQVYTASSNTWATDSEVMPAGPWGDAAICADTGGNVYVVNGVDGTFLYSALQIYQSTAPAGSRWSFGPNPTDGANGNFYSQDSGCAVIGNALYLFAGYGGDDVACCTPQKRTLKLDLGTGVWSNTGQLMKTARFWHGYANISLGAVAAGGTNDLVGFVPTNTAEKYSPSTGWSSMANMPTGRLGPGMGIINVGGFKAAVFGGLDSSFATLGSTIICSLPACPSWSNANRDLMTPRSFHAWGSATANLYAAGGQDSAGTVLSSAEKAA